MPGTARELIRFLCHSRKEAFLGLLQGGSTRLRGMGDLPKTTRPHWAEHSKSEMLSYSSVKPQQLTQGWHVIGTQ